MARKSHICILTTVLVVLFLPAIAVIVGDLTQKIREAEKVEQLYNIRYNISKYKSRQDLSLQQEDSLRKAMARLTIAFADFHHYRNAVDAYREYLSFNEDYQAKHLKYFTDSIHSSHNALTEIGNGKLQELVSEIAVLERRQAAVASLKARYYLFGGIAGIAIVVISILLAIAKSRSIAQVNQKLAGNREQISALHHQVTEVLMLRGTLAYNRHASDKTAELLQSIQDGLMPEAGTKQTDKAISALSAAIESLGYQKS
jgi:hypothetical protein